MSKGLDELKEIKLKWQYGVFTFIPNFELIEKELKALEVIKKMFNDGNYLVRCNGHSYYIWDNVLMATSCIITKKEYDLLKEVLV